MTCVPFNPKKKPKAHTPTGKKPAEEDYHKKIDELADKYEKEIIEIRHDFHKNPELPNREFKTAKKIAEHLKKLKFDEVRTEVGVTGVVGLLKGGKPGKCIALRADFDALPVKELVDVPYKSTFVDEDYPGGAVPVMHACGHETHAAMLLGAASILAEMRDEIPGSVKFLFQPAEEGPPVGEDGGALMMIKEGALENPRPECCFGMHSSPFPLGQVFYKNGPLMAASELFKIEIQGQQVHGSTPWMGKDPMPVAAEIITAFGQIYRQIDTNQPITISIGKVDTVGRFNIIGDNITLWGTVRCVNEPILDKVNEKMELMVEHIAKANGLTATISYDQKVCNLINKPEWTEKLLPSIERTIGEENIHICEPVLAYDDVSEFIKELGGMYFFLGGQDTKFTEKGLEANDPKKGMWPNHNANYYVMDESFKTGMRIHCNVVLDYLNSIK